MKVCELEEALDRRLEAHIETEMGRVVVADDASHLSIGGNEYALDEVAEKAIAKYLKIPPKYLANCSPEFKATTLSYWCDVYSEADTVFETVNQSIVSVHSPESLSIPVKQVGKLIGRVFSPDDDVTFHQDDTRLHVDIVTNRHQVEVLNPGGMPNRPAVGDITRGGVRILTYPHQGKAPSVLDYLERLICTNGMTRTEQSGQISIKGQTLDEVLLEMEAAAHAVLGGLDEKLEKYAATAATRVPGTPLGFAYQLGRESNFPSAVMHRVVALVNQLPPDASVYDVNQAFTTVANYDLPYSTRMRLQALGGTLAFNADQVCSRCDTCEQLIT